MTEGRSDISVIVTTYQRPDALDRVLDSLAAQRCLPREVIVADDGSKEDTAACVEKWGKIAPFPVLHAWQPDQGFRAGAARNRAVARATGDYLIFLDGDCMVLPNFLCRHAALREKGRFVPGNRILLSSALTQAILEGAEKPLEWGPWRWLQSAMAKEANRLTPLLSLPGHGWRKWRGRQWQGVRTCNLAVSREDFFAVNGFDETYEGWGHEDADLAVRLIRRGCLRKDGQFAVPVLHLWHPEASRALEGENLARLQEVLQGGRDLRAARGVSQYLPS